jgi:hypothetical protein
VAFGSRVLQRRIGTSTKRTRTLQADRNGGRTMTHELLAGGTAGTGTRWRPFETVPFPNGESVTAES